MQTPMLDIDTMLTRAITITTEFERLLPGMHMPFSSGCNKLRNDSLKHSLYGVPVLVESETPHFVGYDETPRYFFLALSHGQFFVLEYQASGRDHLGRQHVDSWPISTSEAVAWWGAYPLLAGILRLLIIPPVARRHPAAFARRVKQLVADCARFPRPYLLN